MECITDDRLLEEYGTEIGRELRLLGVHAQLASVPASLEAYVRGLAGEGVLSVPSDLRLLADSLVPSAVLHSGAADYLEALIPPFIPSDYRMDDFTMDEETQQVTITYNMNRIIVENKSSEYVAPFFH